MPFDRLGISIRYSERQTSLNGVHPIRNDRIRHSVFFVSKFVCLCGFSSESEIDKHDTWLVDELVSPFASVRIHFHISINYTNTHKF